MSIVKKGVAVGIGLGLLAAVSVLAATVPEKTTEADCTAAGYYWYKDTCYDNQVEALQAQIADLTAQLNALTQQLKELQGQQPSAPAAAIPEACQGITFERNLKIGMTGNDVKCLQALLNTDPDTQVATEGYGSPGNETNYFGPLTKAAVIKFQEKYADEILAPWGLTKGTGFVGPKTRAKLNELLSPITVPPTQPACTTDADCNTGYKCVEGSCVKKSAEEITTEEECTAVGYYWYEEACHEEAQAVAAGLTVTLAEDTPASTVLLGKQIRAPLLKVVFTNGDTEEGKVTELTLKRIGISKDGTLDAIYLLDEEGNRIGDEEVFIDGEAVFKDSEGLFTIGAGEKRTILVVGDVAEDQSGYTIGVSLVDVKGTFTGLNATFPISGNLMSIAGDVGTTITYDSDSSNGTTQDVQAGKKDVTVWKGTLTPSAKVKVSALAFKGIGNIEPNDLKNYRIYLAGSQVGGAVEMNSDYVVKVDVSDNPVTLTSGAKELKVVADVVGGTGRNVYFEIYPSETVVADAELGVGIEVTRDGGNADWQTINITGATAQLLKASDSPVSVATTTDALVAKFILKAFGERVKFTGFNATSVNATLTEVVIYVDGTQVTDKKTLNKNTKTSIDNTTNFYVNAGEQVTVEVKANTTGYSASSIKLQLQAVGESKTVSSVESNVAEAQPDVVPAVFEAKFANAPDSFLAAAGSEALVAQYKFTAKGAPVTLKTLKFDNPAADISGLKVVLGGNEYTAVQEDSQWVVKDINYEIAAGKTETGDVKVSLNLVSSATDGANAKVTLATMSYSQADKDYTDVSVNETSNDVYVYKAVPEVEGLTSGSQATLTKGVPTTVTLYKWKVKAVGDIINSQPATTTITIEKSGATATTTVDANSIRLYKNGTDITAKVVITTTGLDAAASTAGSIVITASSTYPDILEVLAGNEITLELKADVKGEADNSYIKAYLSDGASDFTWYDGLKDVTDKGNLIKGLPTPSYQQTVI